MKIFWWVYGACTNIVSFCQTFGEIKYAIYQVTELSGRNIEVNRLLWIVFFDCFDGVNKIIQNVNI